MGPKPSSRPPSLHRNVALCCGYGSLSSMRTMRSLHNSTKRIELARILFSIGMTAFVSVGTFLTIRYLIGMSG
jgi:hypothetical protein